MILVSVICLIVPVGAGIYLSPRLGWLVIAVLMVVYFLFLGRWISGRPLGTLISERNLMSLSRFQMVSWTVLLLSAFAAHEGRKGLTSLVIMLGVFALIACVTYSARILGIG